MNEIFRIHLILFLVFSSIQSIVWADYKTIKEERSYADPPTEDWVTNGVITPLDQEMRNFYVRNADGAIEVLLEMDAQIGLQSIYHPPTNCGPIRTGVGNIVQWLGAYDQPGLGWDVISFNFGQWDSGNTKSRY